MGLTLSAAAATWEQLPPLPEPSAGFICGALAEGIVIAGGTNWKNDTKHWLDHIWVFEPTRNAWRAAGRLATPLAYAASGHTKDGLWFAGGSSGTQTHATLSLLNDKLAAKAIASIEQRIVFCASAVLGRKLFVIGGARDQAKVETLSNACFAIALPSGKTTRIADLPVPGYVSGAAAACDGRIFVFGGARWDAASGTVINMAGTFAYSPRPDRWEQLAPYPFPARGLAAVALDSRHILIAGGYKNDAEEFTNEAHIFDTQTGVFEKTTPLPYRALATLVKSGDFLYCLGGEDRKKHRSDAAWRIQWRELLPNNEPVAK